MRKRFKVLLSFIVAFTMIFTMGMTSASEIVEDINNLPEQIEDNEDNIEGEEDQEEPEGEEDQEEPESEEDQEEPESEEDQGEPEGEEDQEEPESEEDQEEPESEEDQEEPESEEDQEEPESEEDQEEPEGEEDQEEPEGEEDQEEPESEEDQGEPEGEEDQEEPEGEEDQGEPEGEEDQGEPEGEEGLQDDIVVEEDKTVSEDVYGEGDKTEIGKPSISASVSTEEDNYENGDYIVYNLVLVNDGEVDLENISILDDLNGRYEIESLSVGEEKTITKEYAISPENELDAISNDIYISTTFNEEEIFTEVSFTVGINMKEDELAENIPPILGEPDIVLPDYFYRQMRRAMVMSAGFSDTIEVDKSAERIFGECRTFEVTLDIFGEPQEAPVDVVLVLDRSGSMNEKASTNPNRSRLYYAKEAAINFAGKVLGPNGVPGSRVSVVSFSGPQYANPGWFDPYRHFGKQNQASTDLDLSSNLSAVTNTINSISAVGGTNTEAGFKEAQSVIQGSTSNQNPNSNKVVIMFTDGIPTASNGNPYGPGEPTSHNNHTIAAYTAGQNIYQNNIADVFTIGLLQNMSTNVKNLAIDTLTLSQNKGFYEAPTAQDLDQIFDDISQNLGYSATNAVVVDKIGDNFELVVGSLSSGATYDPNTREITWTPGTIGSHAQLKYKVQAKSSFQGGLADTNEYATLTYTDANGNQGQTKDFQVPEVDVPAPLDLSLTDASIILGDSIDLGTGTAPSGENYMSDITGGDGDGTYTYEWREVGDSTIISTDENPTVSPTEDTEYELTVIDSNGCKAIVTMKVTVEDPKGSITITKVVQNPKAEDADLEFDIFVNGPDGSQYVITLKNGESQTLENLKIGEYTISEVVPMNYKLVGISNSTIILDLENLEGSTTVTNKPDNDGWFYDDDPLKNSFKVGEIAPQNIGTQDVDESDNENEQNPEEDREKEALKPKEAILPDNEDEDEE